MGSLGLCLRIFLFWFILYHMPLKHQIFPKASACLQSGILSPFPKLFLNNTKGTPLRNIKIVNTLSKCVSSKWSELSNHPHSKYINIKYKSFLILHFWNISISWKYLCLEILYNWDLFRYSRNSHVSSKLIAASAELPCLDTTESSFCSILGSFSPEVICQQEVKRSWLQAQTNHSEGFHLSFILQPSGTNIGHLIHPPH